MWKITCIIVILVSTIFAPLGAAAVGPAFEYPPISEPIVSATIWVDVAAMNAHRTLGGHEMNCVHLIDPNGIAADYDVSDGLFGTAAFPAVPPVNLGATETGIISAPIASSFYPVLAAGRVGLKSLFTDTVDGAFALDCIALTIRTNSEEITSYYGWPAGSENNGFGIGLADGATLPSALPNSIAVGATGTGFDETIGGLSIRAVAEPKVELHKKQSLDGSQWTTDELQVNPTDDIFYQLTVNSTIATELLISDLLDRNVTYQGTWDATANTYLTGAEYNASEHTLNYALTLAPAVETTIIFKVSISDLMPGMLIKNAAFAEITHIQVAGTETVQAQVVPEPATVALFGVGLFGLFALVQRRRRKKK